MEGWRVRDTKVLSVTSDAFLARVFFVESDKRPAVGGAWEGHLRDLIVWQRAIELTFAIYKLTAGFPESERCGLSGQVRRAAVSIASNISEGYGRSTSGEYALFLGHARGSVCEVQAQLVIAAGLGYGSDQTRAHAEKLAADVSRMLNALLISVKQRKPLSR